MTWVSQSEGTVGTCACVVVAVDMIKTSAQTEQIFGLDYGFGIQIFSVGSRQRCSLCVENPCQQVLTVINKLKILAFASLPIPLSQLGYTSTITVL